MPKLSFLLLASSLAVAVPYDCTVERFLGCCGVEDLGHILIDSETRGSSGQVQVSVGDRSFAVTCRAGAMVNAAEKERKVECAVFEMHGEEMGSQVTSFGATDKSSLISGTWIATKLALNQPEEGYLISCLKGARRN